jgi:hypothetical protein
MLVATAAQLSKAAIEAMKSLYARLDEMIHHLWGWSPVLIGDPHFSRDPKSALAQSVQRERSEGTSEPAIGLA